MTKSDRKGESSQLVLTVDSLQHRFHLRRAARSCTDASELLVTPHTNNNNRTAVNHLCNPSPAKLIMLRAPESERVFRRGCMDGSGSPSSASIRHIVPFCTNGCGQGRLALRVQPKSRDRFRQAPFDRRRFHRPLRWCHVMHPSARKNGQHLEHVPPAAYC